MTGTETNPSLLPDTPSPSQNNTVIDVGVIEPAEGTPSVDPAVNAPSAAGEQESVPYPSLRDDGRPRTRIVVRPRWALPDEEVEGAGSAANNRPASDPAPASNPERLTDFERDRLNWVHSYYRGTVAGAIEQSVLYGLSHLAEGEEETPRRRAEIAFYRPLYQNVVRDLQRFDQLSRIEGVANASTTRNASTPLSAPANTPQFDLLAKSSQQGPIGTFVQERDGETPYPLGTAAVEPGSGSDQPRGKADSGRRFAQRVLPPALLFARPPVVPRPLRPLEELPEGSAGGSRAGFRFRPSLNKQQPERVPCIYCGKETTRAPGPDKLNGEHIIPRSRGGNGGPENYAPACRTCNLKKGPRTPEEWYRSIARGEAT